MLAVIVPPLVVDPIRLQEFTGLADLQALVGAGYIEPTEGPGRRSDLTGYVNEEGKMLGLVPNPRATWELRRCDGLVPGDFVAGPWIICGLNRLLGTHTELPADMPGALQFPPSLRIGFGHGGARLLGGP